MADNGGAATSYQKGDVDTNGSTQVDNKPKWHKWGIIGIIIVAIVGVSLGLAKPWSQSEGVGVSSSSDVKTSTSSVVNSDVDDNGEYTTTTTTKKVTSKVSEQKIEDSTGISVDAKSGQMKLFDEHERFVLEDYDAKPTWTGFLPGVAGYYGKPVWAFYVNRGQGIATFGTDSKDYPMLEFNPANKAYIMTPYVGFRTFVRGTRKTSDGSTTGTSFEIEPFAPSTSRNLEKETSTGSGSSSSSSPEDDKEDNANRPKRIMFVGQNDMEVKEVDVVNGLTTSASYIVLPEEDFSSFVRRVNFTNTGNTELTMSGLDGLARMEPVGGKLDWNLKFIGRTLEGWMDVYHADDTLSMPFFKMSTEPQDTADVVIELGGHYCLSYIEPSDETKPAQLLPIAYDTNAIFGQNTALEHASGLERSSVKDIISGPQYGAAKTSSAFAAIEEVTLKPGESVIVTTFYGKADNIEKVPDIAETVTQPGYAKAKFARARSLMTELTEGVDSNTTNNLFDGAVRQMYLDNSLRGGMPTIIGNGDEDKTYDEDKRVKVYHPFSRIHGDLERDYNNFSIKPSYFSQGPGNYRDIAQNRRDDVTFQPRVGSYTVQLFLSFIQADGYEPLTVEATAYLLSDKDETSKLCKKLTSDEKSADTLTKVLSGGPIRPGQIFELVDMLGINIADDKETFLNEIVGAAEDIPMGVFKQGYWGDHWDYYIDIIESFTAMFPDKEEEVMYDTSLKYFFSSATIKPRSEKYVLTLTFDGSSKHVQQLDSTYEDADKAAEQAGFLDPETGLTSIDANWQRTTEGVAFRSSAIAKLFLLGALKFATRDPYGMAIEYEGGRPGWNDAMNGLPAMIGGGMPETYELYELLKYVKKVVDTYGRSVVVPSELGVLVQAVTKALDKLENSGFVDPEDLPLDVPEELFQYWDVVAAAREDYRNNVQYYFSGNSTEYSAAKLSAIIKRWMKEIKKGMDRAVKFGSHGFNDDGTSGIPPAYFAYDVTEWVKNKKKNAVGLPLVNAKAMKLKRFPMFLESPTRYMKIIKDDKEAMTEMYNKVLKSGLRDEELKMYTLSASLEGQSPDMGRMMAFSPGWLENQSVWMHMSYKYYLQLLRGKLYEEFFSEMKNGGILPFMQPKTYGRSLLECSSFIASSAFVDPNQHGRGFLPRLSGSTAEFLTIYKLMFMGSNIFFIDDNGLQFQLVPALPYWLFEDKENTSVEPKRDDDGNVVVSFKLFGTIVVTYHNSKSTNLYGVSPDGYLVTMKDGTTKHIKAPTIPTETALLIRKNVDVASIDAFF